MNRSVPQIYWYHIALFYVMSIIVGTIIYYAVGQFPAELIRRVLYSLTTIFTFLYPILYTMYWLNAIDKQLGAKVDAVMKSTSIESFVVEYKSKIDMLIQQLEQERSEIRIWMESQPAYLDYIKSRPVDIIVDTETDI